MKNELIIVLLIALMGASAKAGTTGYYLGLSLLDTEAEFADSEDGDSGLEVRFGYGINDYVAVEANYVDLGTWEITNISDGGGSVDTEGFGVNVVGIYPIDDFKLLGKLGSFWWDSDGRMGSISGPVAFSDDGTNVLWGVGVSYGINDNFEVNLEYNDSDDFKWTSLGFNYRF